MKARRTLKRLVTELENEIAEYNRVVWRNPHAKHRKINHWDTSGNSKVVSVARRNHAIRVCDPDGNQRNQVAAASF